MVSAAGSNALVSIMPSLAAALEVPDVWISLSSSWAAVLWMVCAPRWARRSDRRGRKAMMAVGLWGFTGSMALGGVFLWLGLNGMIGGVTTLLLFMAARSLYGLFGSAAPPAVQAYAAARTPPEERTRIMALVASSFGLGTVIGPALAPLMLLPGLGMAGPCLAFAFIGLAVLVALRLGLPHDSPGWEARGQPVSEPQGQGVEALGHHAHPQPEAVRLGWREPRIAPWIISMMLGFHAQATVAGVTGFLVIDRLALRGDPEAAAGYVALVMMAGALATLVAQWGLIPNLHLGPRKASLWGLLVAAVGAALLASAQGLHALALGFAVSSVGFGLFRPGVTSGASLAVERHEQGAIAGITASIAGSAFIVTPTIGVWLYGHSVWGALGTTIFLCLAAAAIGRRGMVRD